MAASDFGFRTPFGALHPKSVTAFYGSIIKNRTDLNRMENLKPIVECLLFTADQPLTMEHFKKALPDTDPSAIRQAIADLREEHASRTGGFLLHEVAGGFQFRTRPEYASWVQQLFQPAAPRLSRAAMETLAIIAYRQPVLRSEIEQIRGVNSGNTIKILLERRLIRVLGRREIPGRPLVYATTRKFLETFDLKDLKDLPAPEEIDVSATASPGAGRGVPPETETPCAALPPDNRAFPKISENSEPYAEKDRCS
jgi:segregation and condensation protein B